MTNQRTLALIKPDAVARPIIGAIITLAEQAALRPAAMRMLTLTREEASDLYAEHAGRHYFEPQVEFMTSGPILAMVLEGPEAIATWRRLMGATDREKAEDGTIRKLYALSYRENSAHGSDSEDNAQREIAILFPDLQD